MTSFLQGSTLLGHCIKVGSWFLFISSFWCCTSIKTVTYFQDKGSADTARYATLAAIVPPVSTIQPNDVLAIIVTSLSEESNALFNILNTTTVPLASYGAGAGSQSLGYLVDPMGNVTMPLVGEVKLTGLTLEEASQLLNEKLSKYLKETTVNVRYLNRKFTVIGEVTRPGVYNLLDNNRTLPEVLGIAGDLTVFGRRDNVMIIRTTADKREVIKVDLTNRSVLESPYYYIQNNDVVYVEALPGKTVASDRTRQLLPIYLSAVSTLLIIVNILR